MGHLCGLCPLGQSGSPLAVVSHIFGNRAPSVAAFAPSVSSGKAVALWGVGLGSAHVPVGSMPVVQLA